MEFSWEELDLSHSVYVGYEGSPTWNRVVSAIPWDRREDFEEGLDTELVSWVISHGGLADWRGFGERFSKPLAHKVLNESPKLREAIWDILKTRGDDVKIAINEDADAVAEFVKWQVSYHDMDERQKSRVFKKGKLADFCVNDLKPELNNRQHILLEAFNWLALSRGVGMNGPEKISISAIKAYAETSSIPPSVLVPVIISADNSYINWWHRNKQPQKKETRNGTRSR